MISYLGSLVQFSPAAGRAGRCRQMSLCVGSTPRVPATLGLPRTGVSVLSPSTLLRLRAVLYGAGPELSAVPVYGSCTKARVRLRLPVVSSPASAVQAARGPGALSPDAVPFPSAASGSGSQRLVQPEVWRPLPGAARLFPPRPQCSLPVGSQEVLRQEPGPVCRVGGGGFSGAEFAPCPSPCLLPPAGMGRLLSGVSQSLCFANRRRCVPAGQFFSRSPTV